MLHNLKNIFFPRIIRKPPTRSETQKRRDEIKGRLISAHAEGNISLFRGRYRLAGK